MGVTLTRQVDDGVGERRELVLADGRPVAIGVQRRSWRGRRALWGEAYVARVTAVDRARRGAFLDLGLAQEIAFLPIDADCQAGRGAARRRLLQGELVGVLIVREAARAKSPVAELRDIPIESDRPGALAALAREPAPYDGAARAACDEAIEAALAKTAPVPGGGRLVIEPTAALAAIDVDAADRRGSSDPERFAAALNIAAAREIVRQLRLRRIGGLVAVDFVSMKREKSRLEVQAALREALISYPASARAAPMSPFGVVELSLAQLETPLHEIYLGADGRKTAETVALEGLRALEREAVADRGAQLVLSLAAEPAAWLEGAAFDWRAALAGRIGARFALAVETGWPRERIDVARR